MNPIIQRRRIIALSILILLLIIGYAISKFSYGNGERFANVPLAQSGDIDTPKVSWIWQKVIAFKNNGQKNSPTFHLNGGEVKIKYKYTSTNEMIASFSLFVINDQVDIDRVGAIPELSTSQSPDNGESYIHKRAGDYYLKVISIGKYEVEIFEKN